jgi:hypothetical protein
MKDTKKILRTAIFNALGGLTYSGSSVPVYDEKQKTGQTNNLYVLLGTQQETDVESNDSTWITKSSIDIEIVHKTGSEVSKDVIDTTYENMMEILIPTPQTVGLTIPAGFQFLNATRDMSLTQSVEITATESVLVCFAKLSFTIVQK